MANEITRRNFIKGAAAAAIAVSLSGCGDTGYDVGEFRIYFAGKPAYGWMDSDNTGFVRLNINVKGTKNTLTLNRSFGEVFQAQVQNKTLELENKSDKINILQGLTQKCTLTFKVKAEDRELYNALCAGNEPMVLTVTLSAQNRQFALTLPENKVVPQG